MLLFSLALGYPLLSGSVLAGHDMRSYLMYARETAANLREGILLPAWASELNAGYGGPGLLFYPPVANLLHALPALVGVPLVVGISLLAVLAHFLSGVAVRGWFRAAGHSEPALPAALVYMAAPYRVVDLYERTALAEHWAFLFPPFVLWIAATSLRPGRKAALTAFTIAALLLTNLPLAILFGLLLAVWLVHPAGPAGSRLGVALGSALGGGLALFALVPQALSSRWVVSEIWFGAGSGVFRPSENALFHAGGLNDPFNTTVSWVVVGTVLLVLLAFGLSARDGARGRLLWLCAGVVGFLLTLRPAGPLWDALPVLSKLQFPWRVAAPMTLALTGLVAFVPAGRRVWLLTAAAVLSALPFVGRLAAPFETAVPAGELQSSPPGVAAPDPRALFEASALAGNPWIRNPGLQDIWYLPRTLRPRLVQEVFAGGAEVFPALRHQPAVLISDPEAVATATSWRRLSKEMRVSAPRAGRWVLRCLFFPGFAVDVDGRRVPELPEPDSGLLSVMVPAGEHVVAWRWSPFEPLVSARKASLAFLLAALLLFVTPRPRPARQEPVHG